MVYSATVVRVMIASPSDVVDARDAVEQALHGWNDAHSEAQAIALQPWRWETASVPVLGNAPQALINAQGLDEADIVIGLFGSRLGSPTPAAVSGTVEEIERAAAAGKPVHLFFSLAPLPPDVDTRQLDGLREFKQAIRERGLYGEYHNPTELGVEVWKLIAHDLATLVRAPTSSAPEHDPVSFRVQSHSAGKDHWIEITNRSSSHDAEQVVVEQEGNWAGRILATWHGKTIIHPEQTRTVKVLYFLGGGSGDPRAIRITWQSEGRDHSKVFFID
ncbi:DUF4062 domain-containing protein [Agromyces sp. NPDC056523]|uniref:DUF4062 domain-containing protein n=1 Tax=Agromyces sp. NPDC056523 TaxID=3345850 RepID=UPI003672748B